MNYECRLQSDFFISIRTKLCITRVTCKERDSMDGTIFNVLRQNAVIFSLSSSTMIDYFGINGTITCIVTLFLAEYCGFG